MVASMEEDGKYADPDSLRKIALLAKLNSSGKKDKTDVTQVEATLVAGKNRSGYPAVEINPNAPVWGKIERAMASEEDHHKSSLTNLNIKIINEIISNVDRWNLNK